MPAVSAPAKVLVSGANGYVAIWLVRDLLDHGYSVRGTVRGESKTTHLRNVFKTEVASGKLELAIVSDITAPGAFDEAVKGVDAIAHTASPFHYNADEPSEIIDPAVKGTVGILESAVKYAGPQLKRIAVTSSCAAILDPAVMGEVNENIWNNGSIAEVREKGRAADQTAKYCASKTLAEKAAWDFVDKHKSEISWDLTVLNPPFVFGPILHEVASPDALNSSVALFYEAILTKNKTPEELLAMQFGWVDVRDVARGHVLALESPRAGGERFVLCSGHFIWQDWFDAVNELNIPEVDAPIGTPGMGKDFKYAMHFDNTKARTVLKLNFRDKLETARDSVKDFRSRGW
ncbi:hypothetical protein EW145_g2000 [Phellinidium pouzarii]|uniref:NAD-dependent epimerase/dehydratase domain-containing protein n=1 Tax=Phellinidium pouzarii TaxID=167371 RepID=A0A4S4LHX1_9AGAM|nr:hypothetical protein EW145_g2000 [Phellinidium pouzarii]